MPGTAIDPVAAPDGASGARFRRRDSSQADLLARRVWPANPVVEIQLPGDLHAGHAARLTITEQHLADLSGDDLDMMRLLVTELVNNAVEHGGADAEHQLIVYLAASPACVRAEVWDRGPWLARDAAAYPDSELRGNGFVLLDGFASRWGFSTRGGTHAWFELDRDRPAAAPPLL
jgi:anti-sigma regulatory factor (Ser/Thr protein kinase)